MGEEATAERELGRFVVPTRPVRQTEARGVAVDDERFMRRALGLAAGPSFTSPNPRVGAVVVRAGEIVGEGAHRGHGNPHAETEALRGVDAEGATLYVNLEPCNHHAGTPPCTDALIAAGVSRVVAAMIDPDPRVSGTGVARLRAEGIQVDVGILESDALDLNAPFVHHKTTGRSFVTLKLAQTIDGRSAGADGEARWITGEATRKRVHEMRARADAVMVGANTALMDDPQLTAREVGADRQPTRVIVDSAGRTPVDARVFDGQSATLVATTDRCAHDRQVAYKELGAEVLVLPEAGGRVDLRALVEELGRRDVLEILCEGGARLASALLDADLVGRLVIHSGPVVLGGGASIELPGARSLAAARRWRLVSAERVDDDVVAVYGEADR